MKLRALVVEDCPSMRRLLMHTLLITGLAEFQFTEAADGREALARFDPGKTDIVFVDWNMPGLPGIDLVRKLRATGKANSIPIVMVTGNGTMGNIKDALDGAKADVYITKPYTVDEVRKRLAKLIEGMAEEEAKRSATKRPNLWERLAGGTQ